MELARVYAESQARVIDLVSPLTPRALATTVPGTPLWTVEQLVAHVTGVCADVCDGRDDEIATENWTARQVAERAGRPLADVLAEWRRRTPQLLDLLATPRQVDATAFDILTHEHDLRGALGVSGPSDAAAIAAAIGRVSGRVGHLAAKAGLPALQLVSADGSEWVCGPGAVAVTGTAPIIEWFRALFGRRSAAQILTFEWDGDPAPYFEVFNLFGPLPAVDVAEAGAPVPET